MQISCPNCHIKLTIADDKIAAGKNLAVACPGCKHPFSISAPSQPDQQKAQAATSSEKNESPPEPDFFPPGVRVALAVLRDPHWSKAIRTFLEELKFHVSMVEDSGLASSKLNVNVYDVILVEDSETFRNVQHQIHSWAGTKRRKTNVVLIGTEAESLHPGLAFKKGVDAFFHIQDHPRAHELMTAALDGFDAAYQSWHMAAKKLGKEI